jgi:pimeloyl-ACP methyl ester carboxylesterase
MGWSDPGPETISAGLLADDPDGLTREAQLEPPFILAPSSLGGLTVEMFARRHTDKVAGLVFVDAANSAILEAVNARFSPIQMSTVCLAQTAARFGLLRLLDPFGFRKEQTDAAAMSISRLYRVEPMRTLCGLARGRETTTAEFRAAAPLASEILLNALVHERPYGFLPSRQANAGSLADQVAAFDREWLDLQQRFARSSRRGTLSIVPGSNHLIASSQPHAVASSILQVAAEIRAAR